MWTEAEITRVTELLHKQLGVTYAIGGFKDGRYVERGKPSISNTKPDEFDCSGLTRWIVAQGRDENGKVTVLPHGTGAQIAFCKPLALQKPRRLDLGFADMDKSGTVDHVVVVCDGSNVIEARGKQKGKDYGKVIMRPMTAWEAWGGFMGWWEVPGIYGDVQGGAHGDTELGPGEAAPA